MEGIDSGLHPALDGYSLGVRCEKLYLYVYRPSMSECANCEKALLWTKDEFPPVFKNNTL